MSPVPKSPPFVHESAPGDTAEAARAVRECLRGCPPPERLTWRMGLFDAWAERVFFQTIRPHLLAVREAADAGDIDALLLADRSLAAPESSRTAGRAWLETMHGAHAPGCFRRFTAAVEEGSAPGHFHTVLAARAAVFSLGVLPMLQAALYAEWRAARPTPDSPDSPDEFFLRARSSLSLPVAGSVPYVPVRPIRAAAR